MIATRARTRSQNAFAYPPPRSERKRGRGPPEGWWRGRTAKSSLRICCTPLQPREGRAVLLPRPAKKEKKRAASPVARNSCRLRNARVCMAAGVRGVQAPRAFHCNDKEDEDLSMRSIASILVCGALGSLVSLSAQALPLVSAPANVAGPDVTLVAGGCGLGFHRGPYGGVFATAIIRRATCRRPPMCRRPVTCRRSRRPWFLGRADARMATRSTRMAAVIRSEDKPRRRSSQDGLSAATL